MLITCCLLAADGVLQISGKRKSTSGRMEDKENGKTLAQLAFSKPFALCARTESVQHIMCMNLHDVYGVRSPQALILTCVY